MRYVRPLKSLSRLVWYARHEFTHVLIGLVYAWFLREIWGEFNLRQILWSVFGSLLPDVDHFIYIFFYGRRDVYSLQVKQFLREGNLATLFSFLSRGHKENTNLWSHNVYIISFLLTAVFFSSRLDWQVGTILFGAMVLHFVFDIVDDLLILHSLNPNWKRWGRGRRRVRGSTGDGTV